MACPNPACRRTTKDLQAQLSRLRSTGYDMLKQRGAWQSGGHSHHHLSLAYEEFFAHEVEGAIESLKENSVPEEQARKLLCDAFQTAFEKSKEVVLDQMREALSAVLTVGCHGDRSPEEMYDICRAYGLLLHACHLGKEETHAKTADKKVALGSLESEVWGSIQSAVDVPGEELTQLTRAASQLSCHLVTTVPPLVCVQPETAFCRECHEKEMEPLWDESLEDCHLEYYRSTLFLGYEGRVARKGWVGNTRSKSRNGAPGEGLTQSASDITSSEDFTDSSTKSQLVQSAELQVDNPVQSRPTVSHMKTPSVSGAEQPANVTDPVQTGRTESSNPLETRELAVAGLKAKKCPLHSGKESSIFASLSLSARAGKEEPDGAMLHSTGVTPQPLKPIGPGVVGRTGGEGPKRLKSPDRKGLGPTRSRPRNRPAREEGSDGRFSLSHVWLWK